MELEVAGFEQPSSSGSDGTSEYAIYPAIVPRAIKLGNGGSASTGIRKVHLTPLTSQRTVCPADDTNCNQVCQRVISAPEVELQAGLQFEFMFLFLPSSFSAGDYYCGVKFEYVTWDSWGNPIDTSPRLSADPDASFDVLIVFKIRAINAPLPVREVSLRSSWHHMQLNWRIPPARIEFPIQRFELISWLPGDAGWEEREHRSVVPTAAEVTEGKMSASFSRIGSLQRFHISGGSSEGYTHSAIGSHEYVDPADCPRLPGTLDPCHNGGVCLGLPIRSRESNLIVSTSNTSCQCDAGRYGLFCQTPCPGLIADDSNITCSGNGACMVTEEAPGNFFCNCIYGYGGPDCATVCPEPCGGVDQGQCMLRSDLTTTWCQCRPGWVGDKCQHACPSAFGKICGGYGTCSFDAAANQAKCDCPYFARGAACEHICPGTVDGTRLRVCNDLGQCQLDSSGRSAICVCAIGFYGYKCNEREPPPKPINPLTGLPYDPYDLDDPNHPFKTGPFNPITGKPYDPNNPMDLNHPDYIYGTAVWENITVTSNYRLITPMPPPQNLPGWAYEKIQLVWGVESTEGDPFSQAGPIPVYDKVFNLADNATQQFMVYACERIMESPLVTPRIMNEHGCFFLAFKQFCLDTRGSFPLLGSNFTHAILDFLEQPNNYDYRSFIGFQRDGSVKWFSQEMVSTFDKELPGRALESYYINFEHFMAQLNIDAPLPAKRGVQMSPAWVRMRVEIEFIKGVIWSSFLSMSCVFISLCVFTANIRLAMLAVTTILVIITTLMGLLVLNGLKLGAVEAISLQIVVGMSVDYLLHLGHSYTTSSFYSRFGRSRHAFLEIGAPVVSASATTAVSSFVLIFTTIKVLATVGTIIFLMTVVAITESLLLFLPLLMWLGPTGPKQVSEDAALENPHPMFSVNWWKHVTTILVKGYCCRPLARRILAFLGLQESVISLREKRREERIEQRKNKVELFGEGNVQGSRSGDDSDSGIEIGEEEEVPLQPALRASDNQGSRRGSGGPRGN